MTIQPNQIRISPPSMTRAKRVPPQQCGTIVQSLRQLDSSLGANKNDRVVALICACIDLGVNTGPHIIEVLSKLCFNPKHVGMTLHKGAGNDPKRHYWRRDNVGVYHNFEINA